MLRYAGLASAAMVFAGTSALAGSGSSPAADTEAAILLQLTAGTRGAIPSVASPLPTFVRIAPRPVVSADIRRSFEPLAEAAAAQHGLDVEFFKRLIRQESGYDPNAVSRAGAQGIAQFMPGTAAMVGLDDPFDPAKALPKSAEHLASLRQRLGNDGLAAAAYNAGEGRVRAWLSGRSGLPLETQSYVAAITGRQAHEWAPAGTVRLALASVGPRTSSVPTFARLQSAEWQLGTTLLGPGQARLAALLGSPQRPSRRASPQVASRSSGERALCASLGCIVATVY